MAKPPRSWWRRWLVPRFSLRTLLIVVTILSVVLGTWIARVRQQQVACAKLDELGARWWFDDDANQRDADPYDFDSEIDDDEAELGAIQYFPPGPEFYSRRKSYVTPWHKRLADYFRIGHGQHYWLSVGRVKVHSCESLRAAAELPRLRELDASGTRINDAGLAALAHVWGLESLDLSETRVGDVAMRHLAGLTNLRTLKLRDTNVTDAGVASLAGLTNLTFLDLSETKVTSTGVNAIKKLTNLTELRLNGTFVDDDVAPAISGFQKLERFEANDTGLTDRSCAVMFRPTALERVSLDLCPIGERTTVALGALPTRPKCFLGSRTRTHKGWSHLSQEDYHRKAPSDEDDKLPSVSKEGWWPERTAFRILALHVQPTTESGELISSERLAALGPLPELKKVTLSDRDFDAETAAWLLTLPQLDQLRLTRCRIDAEAFATFFAQVDLAGLALEGMPVSLDTLDLALLSITSLSLRDCDVDAAAMEFLVGNCAPLHRLDLRGTSATTEQLKTILNSATQLGEFKFDADLPWLNERRSFVMEIGEHLEWRSRVSSYFRLGWKGPLIDDRFAVEALENGSNGDTEFRAFGADLGRPTLAELARQDCVRLLRLSATRMTDDDLDLLASMTRLRVLDLSDCRITDAGVAKIVQHCWRLREIDLSGTQVTAAAIPELAKLKFLDYATFRKTTIDREQIAPLSDRPRQVTVVVD